MNIVTLMEPVSTWCMRHEPLVTVPAAILAR